MRCWISIFFPRDMVSDHVGVVFKPEEWVGHSGDMAADGLDGMRKFGLEGTCGNGGTVHQDKERLGGIAGRIKGDSTGFVFSDFSVYHFFAAAIVVGVRIRFLPWMILGDMSVVEVVTKLLLDGGTDGIIIELVL